MYSDRIFAAIGRIRQKDVEPVGADRGHLVLGPFSQVRAGLLALGTERPGVWRPRQPGTFVHQAQTPQTLQRLAHLAVVFGADADSHLGVARPRVRTQIAQASAQGARALLAHRAWKLGGRAVG